MNNEQIVKAIREEGFYDFIANYYYMLTKGEMRDLVLEMFWQLEQNDGNMELAQEGVIKELLGE